MKDYLTAALGLSAVLLFSYYSSSKKAASVTPAMAVVTYQADVEHLVAQNCSPCNIPAKGGKKLALDNYEAVKSNIDEMIARIEMKEGERGFMPMRKPKLSDSSIAVFKQWKAAGLAAE
jgi:hypothetical protein